jgi:hypothetical protein
MDELVDIAAVLVVASTILIPSSSSRLMRTIILACVVLMTTHLSHDSVIGLGLVIAIIAAVIAIAERSKRVHHERS